NELIDSIDRTPFEGIGKPEPLKHELKGAWSRRITDEHRLVYRVFGDTEIVILQCKFHY
ncbi:MAG: Txe/YoeB family addiction module toxin, partial [Bacteroidia bacterium]|nr:Txe/YoeB family addiction module toxin [Bacteroidia bacterium]